MRVDVETVTSPYEYWLKSIDSPPSVKVIVPGAYPEGWMGDANNRQSIRHVERLVLSTILRSIGHRAFE